MIVGQLKMGFCVTRGDAFDWLAVVVATTELAVEAAGVVWLRTVKASSGGPNAADEAWRMHSEKVAALAELQAKLLKRSDMLSPAATARVIISHYRTKVAANHRRLSKCPLSAASGHKRTMPHTGQVGSR